MYSVQGIFQHHFQGKKVCTILDKIQYFIKVYCFWKNLIQKSLLFQPIIFRQTLQFSKYLDGGKLALRSKADPFAVDGDRLLPVPDFVERLTRFSRRQNNSGPLEDARL